MRKELEINRIKRIGEKAIANNGLECEIIEYRNNRDIDVKFSNGVILQHKSYRAFKDGTIGSSRYRVGETRIMNNGQKAIIIKYNNASDIVIQFEDGIVRENVIYSDFKRGTIANYFYPSVYGIGYLGEEHNICIGEKIIKEYTTWKSIIGRCYNKNYKHYDLYGGDGVTVCEEWHNFSNFKKWHKENYYEIENEKIHLDKDILFKDNKEYNPNNCIFVPQSINTLFTKVSKNKTTKAGKGVHWNKEKKKYDSHLYHDGKSYFLGRFENKEEAEEVYTKAKLELIKAKAEEYKNKIPTKLYNRLIEISKGNDLNGIN